MQTEKEHILPTVHCEFFMAYLLAEFGRTLMKMIIYDNIIILNKIRRHDRFQKALCYRSFINIRNENVFPNLFLGNG